MKSNSARHDEEVCYRLAKPRDAQALAKASQRLIEHGLPVWSWKPARMGKAIVAADNITLIATLNERRCGFASMHFGHNEAHLNLLAVEPQYRRQGIARGLLAWLDESCVVAGITTIALEVRASNITAIRFYEALGYNQTACINNYYCGREAAVRMARSISHAQEFVFNRDAER